jgi:hypothetical protein
MEEPVSWNELLVVRLRQRRGRLLLHPLGRLAAALRGRFAASATPEVDYFVPHDCPQPTAK